MVGARVLAGPGNVACGRCAHPNRDGLAAADHAVLHGQYRLWRQGRCSKLVANPRSRDACCPATLRRHAGDASTSPVLRDAQGDRVAPAPARRRHVPRAAFVLQPRSHGHRGRAVQATVFDLLGTADTAANLIFVFKSVNY